ncbi:hypothetical protein BGZ50_008958 [Haplosporangium sp. Z 11]|nr:hypothetical protein BGZ50_008958 [Haplosporangium sp. Z 11]
MSSVPYSHVQWLKYKVDGQEHVTFEKFVARFKLTDQPSATHAYQQLIAFPEIRKSRRKHLQDSFDFFRKNNEKQFWAKRAVEVSTEVVANHALVSVQEFGQVQSQIILESATRDSLAHREREADYEEETSPTSTLPAESFSSAKHGVEQSTLAGSKVAPAWRRSGSQQKRKALMFPVDLKDPSFAAPSVLQDNLVYGDFDRLRERSKASAKIGSLDFATQKAEALALNGIWFVGKAVLPSLDAKTIVQAMSHAYRFTEYKEISALTPSLSEILQTGGEYEISEAIDQLSVAEISRKARKALKVWRLLADTLPSEYRPGLQDGEHTFMNRVLSPFLSVTFSARSNKLLKGNTEHESANEYKTDHKQGVRSDFYVALPFPHLGTSCVGLIGEVKPPEKAQIEQLELQDQWKLFRMMKSEIDLQIKKGIPEPVVWGCQIFGYDLTFYVMDIRVPHIYCFIRSTNKGNESILSNLPRHKFEFLNEDEVFNGENLDLDYLDPSLLDDEQPLRRVPLKLRSRTVERTFPKEAFSSPIASPDL